MRTRRKGRWLLKQPRLVARMCQGTFFFMIHDNRMLAERAFYCYGIYPVEGIGVFRVPKNGDARNKKPPALRVETKRCTKKSPFRYNRVVQALL